MRFFPASSARSFTRSHKTRTRSPARKIHHLHQNHHSSSFHLRRKRRFYPTVLFAFITLFVSLSFILHIKFISHIQDEEQSDVAGQNVVKLLDDNDKTITEESKPSFSYYKTEVDPSILQIEELKNGKPRIPHHIIFLDTRYDTLFDVPSPFQENMQNTIETYLDFWDDVPFSSSSLSSSQTFKSHYDKIQAMMESSYVWYLNNTECETSIMEVAPVLLPFFRNETKGQNKADICRVAALYLRGGYYFDTDMEILKAVEIEPQVTFVSPWEAPQGEVKGLFNSFIAIAPMHPLLNLNIQLMVDYYVKKDAEYHILGTATLLKAFMSFYALTEKDAIDIRDGNLDFSFSISDESLVQHNSNSSNSNRTGFFEPVGMSKKWPVKMHLIEISLSMPEAKNINFPIHDNTGDDLCDYIVHDFHEKEILFYSRISGCKSCRFLHHIPRRAIFIDPSVKTMEELPQKNIDNMEHIQTVYSQFWNATYNIAYEEEAQRKGNYNQRFQDKVVFLGDKKCQRVVGEVEPKLLPYYLNEESSDNKRKLCRLAYLFDRGGYYFDSNLEIINPILPATEEITYMRPLTKMPLDLPSKNTFNLVESFIAVAAGHPLLKLQLENLLNFYSDHEVSTAVTYHNEETANILYKGNLLQGEKSLMLAIEEFYSRDGKGINVKFWEPDLSLREVKLADGSTVITNMLFSPQSTA